MRYEILLDSLGHTPLVGLPRLSPSADVRLWAKLEDRNPTGSVKDRAAFFMVEQAEKEGLLRPGSVILEPTSGNTGISLAMVAKLRGYRLIVRHAGEHQRGAPPAAADVRRARSSPRPPRAAPTRRSGWPSSSPPSTPTGSCSTSTATRPTPARTTRRPARRSWPTCPRSPTSSPAWAPPGTLMGVGRYLREHVPDVKIVAAEPRYGELVYGLRNVDEGFVPELYDESVLTTRFSVSSADALRRTRDLLEPRASSPGISAGARAARRPWAWRPRPSAAGRARRHRGPGRRRRLEVPVHRRLLRHPGRSRGPARRPALGLISQRFARAPG